VGPSRRFIRIPPPPQCKVAQNGLFDNGKITMKISLSLSLSISQWKNSKNKTLKYWSHNSLAELSVYVLIIQLQLLTGFPLFSPVHGTPKTGFLYTSPPDLTLYLRGTLKSQQLVLVLVLLPSCLLV
jgi:hypothetical protein